MEDTLYKKILKSNIAYLDGKTFKDKYHNPDNTTFSIATQLNTVEIVLWDEKNGILVLKTKTKLPEVDETKVRKLNIC